MSALVDWIHEIAPSASIAQLVKGQFPSWPSSEAQGQFLALLTSCNSHCLPNTVTPCLLPHRYLQGILQAVKRDIEGSHNVFEYNDDFIEFYLTICCEGGDEEDSGHAWYKALHGDRLIPIGIKRRHNEVGTKAWTAGIFLTELVQRMVHPGRQQQVWSNKRILELGAGVGITGLVLARGLPGDQQPAHVVVSDYPSEVMDLLRDNTQHLSHWDEADRCTVSAEMINWSQVTDAGCPGVALEEFDCILAADCTYSEDLNQLLVKLFDVYFTLSRPRTVSVQMSADDFLPNCLLERGEPFVLIACTERNAVTFQHFLGLLEQSACCKGVDVTSIAHKLNSPPFYVPSEDRALVRLLCIVSRTLSTTLS